MKLKLNPTKEQKLKLNHWAGCVRFLYNKTISMLTNKNNKTLRNEFKLRDRLVTYKSKKTYNINSFYFNKPWLRNCPKTVKQGAIKEAIANLQSCFKNLQNKNISKFQAPYKTKKKESLKGWCFSVEKTSIHKTNDSLFICTDNLGEMKYYKTTQLHKLLPNKAPKYDCKIQKSMFGEYFLIIPYECSPKPIIKEIKNPVAIDPGIRKYLTTYAPNSKESYILGNRWSTIIMQKCIDLDKLSSIKKKDKIIKKKILKLRKQIHYLKQELKYKCANFIAKEYDLVMIPKLKIESKARKLTTKTVRSLANAGHCSFFDILKDKCWEHGKHFLHVREEYTSKTCPCCGHINNCNEIYKCKNCNCHQDRDIIGAFNILLKGVR